MFKRFLNLATAYYAIISACLLVFSLIFGENGIILEPARFLLILLYCFIMSMGTAIKEEENLGIALRTITHAVCYIGGFFFCIILPTGAKFSPAVIFLAIFSLLYIAVCIVKSKLRPSDKKASAGRKPKQKNPVKNNRSSESEYKSLFSDSDSK